MLKRISIAACGTAYYAGMVARYWFEHFAHLPVEVDIASEFRYRDAPLEPGNLAIFVSQSGETADTLASLRYARAHKQHVLSDRQRADLEHRARKRHRDADARRTGDRRRLDQGVHLPAGGAGRAGDRRRPRARRARRKRREDAGARADRSAAAPDRGAGARAADRAAGARSRQMRATCSISAAAPAIRSRSKAR